MVNTAVSHEPGARETESRAGETLAGEGLAGKVLAARHVLAEGHAVTEQADSCIHAKFESQDTP